MANQQFCLRWNNHQSTLVSVFDTLLERETLVDCTLAAEGQFLRAHKVVLSACSPYLERLLSEHYEKHPILILKDVTFIELRAMLDYMYRGEVNISQEQLGTFLKAAESLQIKGLTDNSSSEYQTPKKAKIYNPAPRAKYHATFPQGLIVEQRPHKNTVHNNNNNEVVRDGSISPKRGRRRRSCDEVKGGSDHGGDSNDSPLPPPPLISCTEGSVPITLPSDFPTNMKVEVKGEELNNDDSGEEKPPYEDEEEEEYDSKPGPSHSVNSHTPGPWNASADIKSEEMSQDQSFWNTSAEVSSEDVLGSASAGQDQDPFKVISRPLVASLKGVNTTYLARLNTTVTVPQQRSNIQCPNCQKCYSSQHTLRRHMRLECGKEPQFHCPYCPRKTKQRYNLMLHIARAHKPDPNLTSFNQG